MQPKIKTNFTPGPWKHEKSKIGFSTCDIIRVNCEHQEGKTVHVRLGEKEYGWSTKESSANADLIEVAPDMFQVLVEICFPEKSSLQHTTERAKKIIEKVTGKTIEELGGGEMINTNKEIPCTRCGAKNHCAIDHDKE